MSGFAKPACQDGRFLLSRANQCRRRRAQSDVALLTGQHTAPPHSPPDRATTPLSNARHFPFRDWPESDPSPLRNCLVPDPSPLRDCSVPNPSPLWDCPVLGPSPLRDCPVPNPYPLRNRPVPGPSPLWDCPVPDHSPHPVGPCNMVAVNCRAQQVRRSAGHQNTYYRPAGSAQRCTAV